MLFSRFLIFLFSWVGFVLKSLIFMIVKDFLFLLKSLNYYIVMLFNKKYFIVKNILLYFYFLYPIYLVLKLIFLIYIFILRYFSFFLFSALLLIDYLGLKVNHLNSLIQNHLKNTLILYNTFNKLFEQGLFSVLIKIFKLIIIYIIYFIVYDLIPFLLIPFVEIFVYFRRKFIVLNDLYLVKVIHPARTIIPYFFRKLGLQLIYFYDYWFFAILKFLFFLIPFYSWQTFLPLVINYFYIFLTKIILNVFYFILYYLFIFYYYILFFFNILFYLIYKVIKLSINLIIYYLNNLYIFFYLIFFKFPFFILNIILYIFNFKHLYYLILIMYFDLKSYFIILKNYITCNLLLIIYK